jgi:hypothetical protein
MLAPDPSPPHPHLLHLSSAGSSSSAAGRRDAVVSRGGRCVGGTIRSASQAQLLTYCVHRNNTKKTEVETKENEREKIQRRQQ